MSHVEPLFGFNLQQKKSLDEYLASEAAGAATTTTPGLVRQSATQAPAAATDVAALKTQFDALLTKLKAAGLMAS